MIYSYLLRGEKLIAAALDVYLFFCGGYIARTSAPAAGDALLVVPAAKLAASVALHEFYGLAVGTAVEFVCGVKISLYFNFVEALVRSSFFVDRECPCPEPVAFPLLDSYTVDAASFGAFHKYYFSFHFPQPFFFVHRGIPKASAPRTF